MEGRLTPKEFSDRIGLTQRASEVIDSPSAPAIPGAPQLRIRLSRPGGTLYVRTSERPHRLARLLGAQHS